MKIQNKILVRNVTNKHFFKKFQGYGFDEKLMLKFKKQHWFILRIVLPSGRCYEITKERFYKEAIRTTQFCNKSQLIIKCNSMALMQKQTTKAVLLEKTIHKQLKEKAKANGKTLNNYVQDVVKDALQIEFNSDGYEAWNDESMKAFNEKELEAWNGDEYEAWNGNEYEAWQ